MAKYERMLTGDFHDLLQCLHKDIMNGSASVSYENGSDIAIGQMNVAVRVYERYSMSGGNRVSLNITLVSYDQKLHVTAITSGGSQAVFFKLNTWGEETFLEICSNAVESYITKHT